MAHYPSQRSEQEHRCKQCMHQWELLRKQSRGVTDFIMDDLYCRVCWTHVKIFPSSQRSRDVLLAAVDRDAFDPFDPPTGVDVRGIW